MGKLTIRMVEKAFLAHHGILLKSAEALGVERTTLYAFLKKHPHLEQVREEAKERLLDVGEGHVATAMELGDMKTVRWAMERLGKNRGYSTRVENTGADGEPLAYTKIERHVVDPNPPKEPPDGDDTDDSDE